MKPGIFGWSYPPGVTSVPGDYDEPCEVCGGMPDDDCICPECPECGAYGDPFCYENHGMIKTQMQKDYLAVKEKEWEEAARAMEKDMEEAYGEADSILEED